MCGRFDLHSDPVSIEKAFKVDHIGDIAYKPSYNVAPTQNIVMIKDDGRRHLVQCRWGFIPSWAADIGTSPMINARAESVADKPAFRDAFRNQRCLVIADGFYEWMRDGKKIEPYYVRLKSHELFGMAGLYSVWTSPSGEKVCTCAIITTDANDLLDPIHDRMPAIIPKENEDLWLNPAISDKKELTAILAPYPSDQMECYEVSSMVNKPDNDSPGIILPVRNG